MTYQQDCELISQIQFHTDLTQAEKNKRISRIERRMERMEQRDLDGKATWGYYE